MFRAIMREAWTSASYPRVSGDVSLLLQSGELFLQLSPRERGCFLVHTFVNAEEIVIPA